MNEDDNVSLIFTYKREKKNAERRENDWFNLVTNAHVTKKIPVEVRVHRGCSAL